MSVQMHIINRDIEIPKSMNTAFVKRSVRTKKQHCKTRRLAFYTLPVNSNSPAQWLCNSGTRKAPRGHLNQDIRPLRLTNEKKNTSDSLKFRIWSGLKKNSSTGTDLEIPEPFLIGLYHIHNTHDRSPWRDKQRTTSPCLMIQFLPILELAQAMSPWMPFPTWTLCELFIIFDCFLRFYPFSLCAYLFPDDHAGWYPNKKQRKCYRWSPPKARFYILTHWLSWWAYSKEAWISALARWANGSNALANVLNELAV